jgi:membrane fusion protein, copper/silver efflux system
MRGLLVVCVLSGQLLVGCSGSGDQSSVAQAQAKPAAPVAANTPAQKLVAAYLGVQQKLAADDAKGASAAFAQLKAAAEVQQLGGDAQLRQRIVSAATAGAGAKDIVAARIAFANSSDGLLEWLKREGNPLASSVRVAHCPMARDGKGARWLQSDAKVKNPYFGSEMLECGSLEKEVKPGAKLN